jgi:uncharacterized membrane protein YciS (DUF1049 family)
MIDFIKEVLVLALFFIVMGIGFISTIICACYPLIIESNFWLWILIPFIFSFTFIISNKITNLKDL